MIDHGLLDLERQAYLDRAPKEVKAIRRKLAVFERFHSMAEHDELISTIIRIRELNRRIKNLEDLQQYTNFDDIEVSLFNQKHFLGKRRDTSHDSKIKRQLGKILGNFDARSEAVSFVLNAGVLW